nr:hypothetical protein [Corynebacterium lactis]
MNQLPADLERTLARAYPQLALAHHHDDPGGMAMIVQDILNSGVSRLQLISVLMIQARMFEQRATGKTDAELVAGWQQTLTRLVD